MKQIPSRMLSHCVRACPKSPSEGLFSEFSKHDFARSDVNGGLGMLSFAFIIFGQTAITPEPGKSALNDPTLWEDLETGCVAFDDFEREAPARNQGGGPFQEFTSISTVGKDFAHPAKVEEGGEQEFRAIAVLHSRAVNDYGKNVYQKVSFSSVDLLASVIATLTLWLSMTAALGAFFFRREPSPGPSTHD